MRGFEREDIRAIREEVRELREKGAVEEVEPHPDQFLSRLFTVPKRDGGKRPVLDLRALNTCIVKRHFRMEALTQLRPMLRVGDWMAKIDIKDAYLHMSMHRSIRHLLRFSFLHHLYEFTSLPFGLTSAPLAFTKILKVPITFLRIRGVRILAYLDDIIILGSSPSLVQQHVSLTIKVLSLCGFVLNTKKCVLTPSTSLRFLGITIDSSTHVLKLPSDKVQAIVGECKQAITHFTKRETITIRTLAHLAGLLNSTSEAVPLARVHTQPIINALRIAQSVASAKGWDSPILLTSAAAEALAWWVRSLGSAPGNPISRQPPFVVIRSDASGTGWGAECRFADGRLLLYKGLFSDTVRHESNNLRELIAAASGVRACIINTQHNTRWAGRAILLESDNTTTVAYLNRGAGNQDKLGNFASSFAQWLFGLGVSITARHLAGVLNVAADALSRGFTHLSLSALVLKRSVFVSLDTRWGPHNIHLFARPYNTQLALYSDTDKKGTAVTTAWAMEWRGDNAFITPSPYCVARVLAKLHSEQATATLVIPAWPTQPWWPTLFSLLIDFPLLLPDASSLWTAPTASIPLPLMRWGMIGVRLSGARSRQEAFRKQLSILLSRGDGSVVLCKLMTAFGPGGDYSSTQLATMNSCLLSLLSLNIFSPASPPA